MKLLSLALILMLSSTIGFAGTSHSDPSSQPDIDPAQAAIFVKDLNMLKQALANGSNVNQKLAFTWQNSPTSTVTFEKATLLMYAISVDWYEGVLELLRAGAKSNVYVKGIKPVNMDFDRCPIKKIAEMSDMMMAVMAGNPDIVKLLIIEGGDTRGSIAVEMDKNCANLVSAGGLMHMRSVASPEVLEILKAGKKAEWVKNGLPAEGERPGK
jgi:hypothetical protein